MRNLRALDRYRVRHHSGELGDETCGCFVMPSGIRVIASSGEGWDHVSASFPDRTPSWDEMAKIKRLFFKDDEAAFQLHVPVTQHINCHPHCLHLWRPLSGEIPVPPSWMVA